jgi:hypothetical protein
MSSLFLFASRARALRLGIALIYIIPLWSQTGWQAGSNALYAPSGTKVGIETTSPGDLLDVRTPASGLLGITAKGGDNHFIHLLGSVCGGCYSSQVPDGDAAIMFSNGTFTGGGLSIVPWGTGIVRITGTGNVGIGTSQPQYKLAVNGTLGAKEVIVTNAGWADYVFKPDYRLTPLKEVGEYIKEHHHLPGIPSEKEVRENGISLGEMQTKMLAKIEELTLHLIQADERNSRLEQQNRELQDRLSRLESRF